MSNWLPQLSRVLEAHGFSDEVVSPGQAFEPHHIVVLSARQFGATRTRVLYDEGHRPAALFELVQHPDCLWINRLLVRPMLCPVAVLHDMLGCVLDYGQRLGVDTVSAVRGSAPDPGVGWEALGFTEPKPGHLVWRPQPPPDDLSATFDGTLKTIGTVGTLELPAGAGAPTQAETYDEPTEAAAWVARGKVLPGGRFVVRELLGRGAMGEVWAADDTRLGASVALKVMRPEHVSRPKYRQRFEQEVRVTAQLDHPGVVSVLDSGTLPDGRVWFVMDRVRGDTLVQVRRFRGSMTHDRDPVGYDQWVRDVVNTLLVVARAVASAHARAVVHRDIKPANIMLGRFGEVLLMDWGVARSLAEADAYFDESRHPIDLSNAESELTTRIGQRVGTPAYMAPEQARGEAQSVGPPSDVFALGGTLFEMLTGRLPARRGADVDAEMARDLLARRGVPPALAALAEACLRSAMAMRPTAEEVAESLRGYLDGTIRRAQAETLFLAVQAQLPEVQARLEQARETRQRARVLLAAAPRLGPIEPRLPGWRLEDEAEQLLEAALRQEASLERRLQSTLELWSGHTGARTALTDLYLERAKRADSFGSRAEVAAIETTLAGIDDPRAAAFLKAEGAVTLWTDPAGATVVAHLQEEVDRRLATVRSVPLGRTPIHAQTLERGSWILEVRAEGRSPVRYPVHIGRGEHWHGIPPGESDPFAIPLPKVGELGPEDCYVPAGWTTLGGDPSAMEGLPALRVWVDGMRVRRYPVTCAEWFHWVDAAAPAFPSEELGVGGTLVGDESAAAYRGVVYRRGDRFFVDNDPSGRWHGGRLPMAHFTHAAATAYAAWCAAESGIPWQLPTELMWEKAARGVDGRVFSWGSHFDCARSVMAMQEGPVFFKPVDEPTDDVGPYGVAHMCGQVRAFCCDRFVKAGAVGSGERAPTTDIASDEPVEWFNSRGGSYHSRPNLLRLANRYANRPQARYGSMGMRLFAPFGRPA